MTKSEIRSKILLKLKAQKEEERNRKSKIIKEKLYRSVEFIKAKIVMFYIAFDGEVDTKDMIKEAQNLGKIVVVPVCKKNRLIKACRLGKRAKMKKGPYGLCEPAIERSINLEDLDLVIVPGIAFDRRGSRLGRGKGYYDRFLKTLTHKTTSIGLAFDFQVLPSLPATRQDVNIDRVIFA